MRVNVQSVGATNKTPPYRRRLGPMTCVMWNWVMIKGYKHTRLRCGYRLGSEWIYNNIVGTHKNTSYSIQGCFMIQNLFTHTHQFIRYTTTCSQKWLILHSESHGCGLLYISRQTGIQLLFALTEWSVPGALVPVSQKQLGFYWEWCNKQKTSSQQQSWEKTACLWEVKGEWQESCMLTVGPKTVKIKIKMQYNSGVQNGISERTIRWSLSMMGYCSRCPDRIPLLSTKNKKQL